MKAYERCTSPNKKNELSIVVWHFLLVTARERFDLEVDSSVGMIKEAEFLQVEELQHFLMYSLASLNLV